MNKIQKLLGIGALTLALSACGATEDVYLEGKVIKEREGVGYRGTFTYLIIVETDEGTYFVDIYDYSFSRRPLNALAESIKIGDKVRFPKTLQGQQSYFSEDRIGSVSSNYVKIIEETKK